MGKVFIHDQTVEVAETKPNARLTVNCPRGSNVDLILDSTVVKSAVSDDSAKVTFSELSQGAYIISINDGEKTVQYNISIVTDHEVTIDPIATTVIVTYPVGAICEIKLDDYNCYMAPDTSGIWKCVIPLRGMWTVSCAKDDRVETKTVDVTDTNQFFNIALDFFEATAVVTYPVGFTCICTDGVDFITPTDDSGTWTCCVPNRGTWSFTCSKDVHNMTKTVDFLVDGGTEYVDFGDNMGTICITYEPGLDCYVTDNTGNVVFYKAPDKSGYWACTVNKLNRTYYIRVSNGVTEKYEWITLQDNDPTKTIDMTAFQASITVILPDDCYSCNWKSAVGTATAYPKADGTVKFRITKPGEYIIDSRNVDDVVTRSKNITITSDWQNETVNLGDFEATIVITYPKDSICTCSNGSTTISAIDTSGYWECLVPIGGLWTIAASNAVQSGTATVDITTYGQNESVTVKFFAATIDITYPPGATCSCTDGITTFTANDALGRWTLTVPRAGEWLIRAVEGTRNTTETVMVTDDGQHINVECEFFVAYINVTYASGSNKVTLWHINQYGIKNEIGTDTSGSGTHAFEVYDPGVYEIGVYRVEPYVGIESSARDYVGGMVNIATHKQTVKITLKYDTLPKFTYTGTYECTDEYGNVIDKSSGHWNIRFLTSGLLKFTDLKGAADGIDVFVLGGGGNGGDYYEDYEEYNDYRLLMSCGGGGGGGYIENSFGIVVDTETSYPIIVGGSEGTSSAFGISASGGESGGDASSGKGGKGGNGTGKGGNGACVTWDYESPMVYYEASPTNGEYGVCPFFKTYGGRYGAGGGGGWFELDQEDFSYSSGGLDGGAGGDYVYDGIFDEYDFRITQATPNTGGGGLGCGFYYDNEYRFGGSGVVIIRNKR